MSHGPYAFKETDVARALRAAAKAGGGYCVRIDKRSGDILILPAADLPAKVGPAHAAPAATGEDALDEEIAAWDAIKRA